MHVYCVACFNVTGPQWICYSWVSEKGSIGQASARSHMSHREDYGLIVSHNNDSLSGVEVRMITGDAS